MKFPRLETGEHWAEKIASEIGNLIGVNCARVELARFVEYPGIAGKTPARIAQWDAYLGQQGTICKSFVPAAFESYDPAEMEYEFFHGWQILEMYIEDYDTELRFGHREHNVKNIVFALSHLMSIDSSNPMPLWKEVLEHLASYALLDGLIANMDRHHENWMMFNVIMHGDSDRQYDVSPSFDHASSLGRELTDDRRRRILASNGVLDYLRRGRGGVFVNSRHQRAPSPLRLAQLLSRWQPGFTSRTLDRIADLSDNDIRTAIDKVPPYFMSDLAKEFAYEVIIASRTELLRSVR